MDLYSVLSAQLVTPSSIQNMGLGTMLQYNLETETWGSWQLAEDLQICFITAVDPNQ